MYARIIYYGHKHYQYNSYKVRMRAEWYRRDITIMGRLSVTCCTVYAMAESWSCFQAIHR